MSWKPLLHYTFETHAGLDVSGRGLHARVELPGPDRWKDQPVAGIATAILFDHPESKLVVAARPELGGWRGVRVRVAFRADAAPGRLNLVEGDGSFALFVEPGGVLRGTVNDGSPAWWGVSSAPGVVHPGRWHLAELLYDSGRVLTLSLDGRLLGTRITAGLPIRAVASAGIRVGYWPGGDARYTFRGLMGPVWIDTFDERDPVVGILNKLLCDGSDGTSRLEAWGAVLEKALDAAEKAAVKAFGQAVADAVKRLAAVVVGQAPNPAAALDRITALADELGRMAARHEAAGTDLLRDPALQALLEAIHAAAVRDNPAAEAVFQHEALRLLAAMPLSPERWSEILARHPELCRTGFPPVRPEGGGGRSWVDDLVGRWCAEQGRGGGQERPGCLHRLLFGRWGGRREGRCPWCGRDRC